MVAEFQEVHVATTGFVDDLDSLLPHSTSPSSLQGWSRFKGREQTLPLHGRHSGVRMTIFSVAHPFYR
jgi:hypothetical protein